MIEPEHAPHGVDPTIPSVARMYDYFLGGKDNFAADRKAAEKMISLVPGVRHTAQDNRDFLGRAVRVAAESGVRQFLDIGAGLPTQNNVHQVALEVAPDSQIVYVDNDPIVLVHGRAILADNPSTTVIQGDVRDPDAILDHPEVTARIDLTRPVALILVALLHFIPDGAEVAEIVTRLRRRLAPGSHLIISHVYNGDHTDVTIRAGKEIYAKTATGSLTGRGIDELTGYFAGMDLLEPGLVPVAAWRPDHHEDVPIDLVSPGILAAVGRLP